MALFVDSTVSYDVSASVPTVIKDLPSNPADLDYDLLLKRVENTIMADKHRYTMGITPKELLARSNPGMFTHDKDPNTNIHARDLTNPRELYNVLSNRTKSIEDLTAKFKQELAKTYQSTGQLPNLSSTVSMTDIDQSLITDLRFGNKPNHAGDMHIEDKRLGVVHNPNKPAVYDYKRCVVDDREALRTLNLPHLNKRVKFQHDTNNNTTVTCVSKHTDGTRGDKHSVQLELPVLSEKRSAATGNASIEPTVNHDVHTHHLLHVREELSECDSKFKKWFSEMPNEVFDKAQRALMEESIKDKLNEYQRTRNRKMNFPNQSVQVCVGSKMRTVPNTYLELHVDSFGKHLNNDDKDENLSRYRLHQKSMLNLKLRDASEIDRLNREQNLPRLALQHRSLTTLALTKSKPKSDKNKQVDNKGVIKIPTEGCIPTVFLNDTFEPFENELKSRQRHVPNTREDFAERLNVKDTPELIQAKVDRSRPNSPPPNTIIEDFDLYSSSHDRDTTKATIVNLSLIPKDGSKGRTSHRTETTFVKGVGDIMETAARRACDINGCDSEHTNSGVDDVDASLDPLDLFKPKHDAIVAKIPTAQSRSTDSKGSSTSLHSSKAALKKFNTLEVFAEQDKPMEANPKRDSFRETKLRNNDLFRGAPLPPSVRLDGKQPVQTPSRSTHDDNINIPMHEVNKQDVVFRFEPGEVFVSRKNPNNQLQTHTRSSERARVIYGKIVNQGRDYLDRKDLHLRPKDDTRDIATAIPSTRTDLLREGSMASYSARRENGSQPDLLVLGSRSNTMPDMNLKLNEVANKVDESIDETGESGDRTTRDVATETDKLGSEKSSKESSQLKIENDGSVKANPEPVSESANNNDAESLRSGNDSVQQSAPTPGTS